jgi:hypothetical protein
MEIVDFINHWQLITEKTLICGSSSFMFDSPMEDPVVLSPPFVNSRMPHLTFWCLYDCYC